MKKSFVVLLLVLAVVVLVSPGIVGRLAERSMDENLDWAATEAPDLAITSQGFDRGWFSSAGQHRIEVREGDLRDLLVAVFEPDDPAGLPALIIDTQLDHGLVPVTSMTREQGSLLPGLGSAVSTLAVEFPGGESFAVPGTIFSRVGLTGDLESNYVLESGSFDAEGGTLNWGQTDVVLTSNPTDGRLALRGSFEPMSAESEELTLLVGDTSFAFTQIPSRFGIPVGDIDVEVESVSMTGVGENVSLGPLGLKGESGLNGDRLSASAAIRVDNAPLEPLGEGSFSVRMRLEDADATAFARLQRSLQEAVPQADPAAAQAMLEADVQRLLAAGFGFYIDTLEVALPAGTIAATSRVEVDETDADAFNWAALLLALDAHVDVSMPVDVVDTLTVLVPDVRTVIALGYLRRQGDDYVVEASLENGTVMINGAPMQLPLGNFR